MIRPILSNLLAYGDRDAARMQAVEDRLRRDPWFARVWRALPEWIVAVAPLPGNPPVPSEMKDFPLIFAEGAEVVTRAGSKIRQKLEEIASVAETAPHHLDRLPGDFGFISLGPDGAATVVRSCGGLVPFYRYQKHGACLITTRLTEMAKYLPEEPGLDAMVNGVWMTGYPFDPDRRTLLKNVFSLPRGHYESLKGGSAQLGRYWRPLPDRIPRARESDQKARAEALGRLLVSRIETDLDPRGGNLLSLSGGVDSSVLAALAGRRVPVSTISFVPPSGPALEHELSYINPLAAEFGFEHMSFYSPGPKINLDLYLNKTRVACQVMHPVLLRLPDVIEEFPVNVLFGGEFADDVCGSAMTIPDWAAAVPLAGLARKFADGSFPNGPKDVLRWVKHRSLRLAGRPMLPFPKDLAPFIRQDAREDYKAWRRERRRRACSDKSIRKYFQYLNEGDGFIAMNWEAASELGIRRSFPFLGRQILELSFSAHPDELVGPGTKKLLKAAVTDQVPSRNLYRPDKGRWGQDLKMQGGAWKEPLSAQAEEILDDRLLSQKGTLSPDELRQIAQLERMARALTDIRRNRLSKATSPGSIRPVRPPHGGTSCPAC